MKVDRKQIQEFKKIIGDYYKKNKRHLPWRNTKNPYNILVSEIMLQQTQVARVLIKYSQFIDKFPDFKTLSEASLADVLLVWQGMGYNRRAMYLKKIAEIVTTKFKGRMPSDTKILATFPGIGKTTAHSICAFAFNIPTIFIETNIRRVFIHSFFKDGQKINDKEILPLVETTLDPQNPREWYYALMDYGAMLVKKVENPNRRSKHYSKQSQFEGSTRQLRGKALRHLLQYGYIEEQAFPKAVLTQMEKEGFIREKKGKYIIR